MAYIKEHFRAGYFRTNKNGTVSYVKGTVVKSHTSNEWRSHERSYSSGTSSLFETDKPKRYREDNFWGGSTSYSYDPKTNTTVIEENDGYRVISKEEVFGDAVPEKKRSLF